MPVTVVVGAQWGDEGKAKIIDLLAKEHPMVVRYQEPPCTSGLASVKTS